jgi:hypothetical protein
LDGLVTLHESNLQSILRLLRLLGHNNSGNSLSHLISAMETSRIGKVSVTARQFLHEAQFCPSARPSVIPLLWRNDRGPTCCFRPNSIRPCRLGPARSLSSDARSLDPTTYFVVSQEVPRTLLPRTAPRSPPPPHLAVRRQQESIAVPPVRRSCSRRQHVRGGVKDRALLPVLWPIDDQEFICTIRALAPAAAA